MKTLLFTKAAPADAGGDAVLLPASNFLSAYVSTESAIRVKFKKKTGAADTSACDVLHKVGEGYATLKLILETISANPKSNIVDVVDIANNAVGAYTSDLITGLAINL